MHRTLEPEPIKLTYADFAALPEDGKRYEILDGDLYVSPSPQTDHQRVIARFFRLLSNHVDRHELGEVFIAPYDVLLGEHDIVEPDIIFVSKAKLGIVKKEHIEGIPDLLIEIVSPSRPEYDLRDKRNQYARCGVPWYWIVNPQERWVKELQLSGAAYQETAHCAGDDVFEPKLFPGLRIELSRIWKGLD